MTTVDELAGVVLAAGAGDRLSPLTRHLPKALCPVGMSPLVDHAIGRVRSATTDVAVNVHYGRRGDARRTSASASTCRSRRPSRWGRPGRSAAWARGSTGATRSSPTLTPGGRPAVGRPDSVRGRMGPRAGAPALRAGRAARRLRRAPLRRGAASCPDRSLLGSRPRRAVSTRCSGASSTRPAASTWPSGGARSVTAGPWATTSTPTWPGRAGSRSSTRPRRSPGWCGSRSCWAGAEVRGGLVLSRAVVGPGWVVLAR